MGSDTPLGVHDVLDDDGRSLTTIKGLVVAGHVVNNVRELTVSAG